MENIKLKHEFFEKELTAMFNCDVCVIEFTDRDNNPIKLLLDGTNINMLTKALTSISEYRLSIGHKYYELIDTIENNEYSDEEYETIFDKTEFDVLMSFTEKCYIRSKNGSGRFTGLKYSKKAENICDKIYNEQKITFNQFKVLVWFYKSTFDRIKNKTKFGNK
jgi:hypothetical protein